MARDAPPRQHFAFSQNCDWDMEYVCLSVWIECLHLSKFVALSFLFLTRVDWLTLPVLCATNSALPSFPPAALQMRSERAASRYRTFPAIPSTLFSTHPCHFCILEAPAFRLSNVRIAPPSSSLACMYPEMMDGRVKTLHPRVRPPFFPTNKTTLGFVILRRSNMGFVHAVS
jgi:hypothetical protein